MQAAFIDRCALHKSAFIWFLDLSSVRWLTFKFLHSLCRLSMYLFSLPMSYCLFFMALRRSLRFLWKLAHSWLVLSIFSLSLCDFRWAYLYNSFVFSNSFWFFLQFSFVLDSFFFSLFIPSFRALILASSYLFSLSKFVFFYNQDIHTSLKEGTCEALIERPSIAALIVLNIIVSGLTIPMAGNYLKDAFLLIVDSITVFLGVKNVLDLLE